MVFLVLSAIVTGVFTIGFFTCLTEDETESLPVIKKILKISTPILAICILIKIFVPTTKEALLIYGVGGTIDYVKSNPTAMKLPDKCVNALDKWVDSWTLDEKTDSIKK
jgi:hypothetical protein